MPSIMKYKRKYYLPSVTKLWKPITTILPNTPELLSRGNRPLQMDFEHHLKILVYYHLKEHISAQELIQELKENNFAKQYIAPPGGIEKSSFSEATNSRGLEQFLYVFEQLYSQANQILPVQFSELGELIAIDGSLIDGVLSMEWADYRKNSKKAKSHLAFDINRSIPRKVYLTDGKGDERPFVSKILSPGQTGVMDRYYQHHGNFDLYQKEGKHFICRIKSKTRKTVIKSNELPEKSFIFYDSIVLLGSPSINQTQKEVRVVGYTVDGIEYWIATDRFDLSAEQIAMAYRLRWEIEKFFGWWKRHLKVYHLIARSEHGLMIQILAGLITYLLLAIYCHEEHGEKVSIKRVRELRNQMQNEVAQLNDELTETKKSGLQDDFHTHASP